VRIVVEANFPGKKNDCKADSGGKGLLLSARGKANLIWEDNMII